MVYVPAVMVGWSNRAAYVLVWRIYKHKERSGIYCALFLLFIFSDICNESISDGWPAFHSNTSCTTWQQNSVDQQLFRSSYGSVLIPVVPLQTQLSVVYMNDQHLVIVSHSFCIFQIYIVYNKRTAKPRGYAFIEYEHERDMHCEYQHGAVSQTHCV